MLKVFIGKALEHQHLGARQECAVQFEGWIFGGRADQNDRTVLDIGQKGILLGPVESVNLIHKKDRALAEALPVAGRLEHFPQILHAGEDRGKLLEMHPGAARHQPGNRRLAGSGRTPENHRPGSLALCNPVQRTTLAQKMILPDNLAKRGRTQPVGERTGCVIGWRGHAFEKRR